MAYNVVFLLDFCARLPLVVLVALHVPFSLRYRNSQDSLNHSTWSMPKPMAIGHSGRCRRRKIVDAEFYIIYLSERQPNKNRVTVKDPQKHGH